jgi:hypothetical protein
MSVLRNVIFNLRERITSPDLNQLQAEAAVNSQAAARAQALSGVETTLTPGPVTRDNRGQCSGLAPTLTGVANTLNLSPGLLATYSPAYPAPIAGQAFTGWRLFNSLDLGTVTGLSVPIPAGAPTWYLLEARVGQAITNEMRDIKNTITALFVPTSVPKDLTPTLETQWIAGVAGGKWPAFSGSEWVPICFVARTNVGGIITTSDVHDVRPLPSDLHGFASQAAQSRQGTFNFQTLGGNLLELTTVEPAIHQGVPLEFGAFTGTVGNLDLSTILDTNDGAFIAQANYHLYIAPQRGRASRPMINPYARGRLVLSTVIPTLIPSGGVDALPRERVWMNDSVMVDPGAGASIFPGGAIYIGTLCRNIANTGFARQTQSGRVVRIDGFAGDMGTKVYTQAGTVVNVFGIPPCAVVTQIGCRWSVTGALAAQIVIGFDSYGVPGGSLASNAVAGSVFQGQFSFDYEAAYDGADPTISSVAVVDTAGVAPATWTATLVPEGWTW